MGKTCHDVNMGHLRNRGDGLDSDVFSVVIDV
jgi:hypothetical protein